MSGSVGGVDASIPLQAGRGVQQPNPLATIGEFANAKNALNNLQLFPGQQQLQSGQIALQQQQIQGGQSLLTNQYRQLGAASLARLLAKKGPIGLDDITTALGGAEASGVVTQPTLQEIFRIPHTGNPVVDDANYRAYIAANAQPPNTAVAQVVSQPGPTISTGLGVQPTVVSPNSAPGGATGVVTPAGGEVAVYPSRSELASQVGRLATADDAARLGVPIGTPLTETLLQRLTQQGAGSLVGPAARGGVVGVNGPVSPQSPPRLNQTPPPPSTQPNVAPASTTPPSSGPIAPPAARAPTGAVATGMAPTAPAEMAASTDQYNAASAMANSFQQRVFPLQQAATALKNTDTGPGTETTNQIKSFLLAQSPDSLKKYLPGVDPEKIANYDEAVKYLASYAMNQPGASNSDMHLGLAQTANASTHISQEAAQRVVQNALGLERMQQAALMQFNEMHTDPNTGTIVPGSGAQFNSFMQRFASTHDPRGFSWDDQGLAQQQAALKTITTAAEKRRLLESVMLARQYQLTGKPGG